MPFINKPKPRCRVCGKPMSLGYCVKCKSPEVKS